MLQDKQLKTRIMKTPKGSALRSSFNSGLCVRFSYFLLCSDIRPLDMIEIYEIEVIVPDSTRAQFSLIATAWFKIFLLFLIGLACAYSL